MLIEIKIPKEIREYRESIFFGLTTRQFICSLLALGVAAGLQATIGRLQCWPFGASNRTSVPALLAGGPEARQAVGVYFLLQPYVGTEEIGWMCILAAAPFAACGFFRYHGMTAEQFLWAWVKSELLYPKKLVFRSGNVYHHALEPAIAVGCRPQKKRKNKEKSHGKNA